jgi:hypothetical protein
VKLVCPSEPVLPSWPPEPPNEFMLPWPPPARFVPLTPDWPVLLVRIPEGPAPVLPPVNGFCVFWHPVIVRPARNAPASPSTGFLVI